MPNHILNRLTINASGDRLKEIREFLVSASTEKEFDGNKILIDFNSIIPMPKDLVIKSVYGTDDEELKAKYKSNIEKYGYKDWYDWCCANWGTKWNAYDFFEESENTIEWNTAWNGVPHLIRLVSEKYPEVRFDYAYADEDLGCNCADGYFLNGEDYMTYMEYSNDSFEFAMKLWNVEDLFEFNEETNEWEYIND